MFTQHHAQISEIRLSFPETKNCKGVTAGIFLFSQQHFRPKAPTNTAKLHENQQHQCGDKFGVTRYFEGTELTKRRERFQSALLLAVFADLLVFVTSRQVLNGQASRRNTCTKLPTFLIMQELRVRASLALSRFSLSQLPFLAPHTLLNEGSSLITKCAGSIHYAACLPSALKRSLLFTFVRSPRGFLFIRCFARNAPYTFLPCL